MDERTKIPERILNAGERGYRARAALITEADRLRDKHNLFYKLFIGGLDNNRWSKDLGACLQTVESWMLDDPLTAGIMGIEFHDNSDGRVYPSITSEIGTRVIEYSNKTLRGWNEWGRRTPEGCENLADMLGRFYLATVDHAIKNFQRFQQGDYLDTGGNLRNVNT